MLDMQWTHTHSQCGIAHSSVAHTGLCASQFKSSALSSLQSYSQSSRAAAHKEFRANIYQREICHSNRVLSWLSRCHLTMFPSYSAWLLFALQARINNKNENMFFLTAKQLSESSVFAQKKKNPRKCRALVPACLDVRQVKHTHLIKKVGQHWPQKAPAFAVSWQHFPGIRKTLHSVRPSFVCPRLFDRNLTVALLN